MVTRVALLMRPFIFNPYYPPEFRILYGIHRRMTRPQLLEMSIIPELTKQMNDNLIIDRNSCVDHTLVKYHKNGRDTFETLLDMESDQSTELYSIGIGYVQNFGEYYMNYLSPDPRLRKQI